MPDLTRLPHELDEDTGVCRAVIETPKGRRAKYDYDRVSRLFKLKTILPEGLAFPLDFGFIPSTLCDDGDPLDVMVLIDEPSAVGALVDVRLVAAIEAEEEEKGERQRNDRLLAVAVASRLYADIRGPDDLPRDFLSDLTHFWTSKDKLEGKLFKVLRIADAKAAVRLVRQSFKTFRKAA